MPVFIILPVLQTAAAAAAATLAFRATSEIYDRVFKK